MDVITCAAPFNGGEHRASASSEKLRRVLTGRIRNILEVAAANNADILILGAFGCGAFHNPPQLVADLFRRLLVTEGYGRFFRKTVFAIKNNIRDNRNLVTFQRTFSGWE